MRSKLFWFVGAASAVVFSVAFVSTSHAVPYASSISEAGGMVTFILNEDASSVTINRTGDSQLNFGPLAKGPHFFPLDAATAYEIAVSSSTPDGWTQISDDANRYVQFERPLGIAVNQNPASPAFGRIYVTNPRDNDTVSGRPMGPGLYILGPDRSDILGNGDTASTGGIDFPGADELASPWKPEVGPDDHVYVGDWSNTNGNVYRMDADISSTSGEVVLQGIGDQANPSVHGSISSSPIVVGTLADGDMTLYAIDEDLSPFTSLWQWDIGSGPLPHNTAPTKIGSPLISSVNGIWADLDRGPAGDFYLTQYRFDGLEAGVFVIPDDNATEQWDSLTATRELTGNPDATDMLWGARAVKTSPDGTQLAIQRVDNKTWIIPLEDGIPDLENAFLLEAFQSGFSGRDVSWDAAGNLYVSSSIQELLRVFSPGGDWLATTGSDGTFSLTTDDICVLGDVNGDGEVNGLDVDPFVDVLLNGPYQCEADMNGDEVVNGLDVDPFVAAIVGGGVQAVPEPSTAALLLLGLVGLYGYRRKRE